MAETLAAYRNLVHISDDIEPPCWLDEHGRVDESREPRPENVIAFRNGNLDIATGLLHPPSPLFFNFNAVDLEYDPDAPKPVHWILFLKKIFSEAANANKPHEMEGRRNWRQGWRQILLLQEIMGYLLSLDVSQEKAFLLIGPARSGKGTIVNVLRGMLPVDCVADPSFRSLGERFGLWPLINKQLAVIDDLRVGSNPKDQEALIEVLLRITGRGTFTIDRKNKPAWHGKLPIKLVFISNVVPTLLDDAAAIAGRFIVLKTQQSYDGHVQKDLFEKVLRPELPGILLWALEGLRRLRKRGKLRETAISRAGRQQLADLANPVVAFLRECCRLDVNGVEKKADVRRHWQSFASKNGYKDMDEGQFSKSLMAASGGKVRSARRRLQPGESKTPVFLGLLLGAERLL
jgi:putative DNA primase/helicase